MVAGTAGAPGFATSSIRMSGESDDPRCFLRLLPKKITKHTVIQITTTATTTTTMIVSFLLNPPPLFFSLKTCEGEEEDDEVKEVTENAGGEDWTDVDDERRLDPKLVGDVLAVEVGCKSVDEELDDVDELVSRVAKIEVENWEADWIEVVGSCCGS